MGFQQVTRPADEQILVLAPMGRDSSLARALLGEAGILARSCGGLNDLVRGLENGAGCAVITQEAVTTADLHPLFNWLESQPPWSDLPLIVLTERGGGPERNPGALRVMEALGNVTLLERPFHPATLLSIVQSAIRSRRRQYHARAQMEILVQREASLKDSEARFRTLAENIPVLTWTAHADGWIFWFSPRWYEYTGTTQQQMEGWGWQSVHDPDCLPEVLERWNASIGSGEPFEMVYPLRGSDGVFRPFLTRAAPVCEKGQVVRWFGTNVDISEQREAEATIRASEEKLRLLNETLEQQVAERTARLRLNEARLRTIFETSYQAQGLLAVDGTLLDANATSLALVGGTLDDVAGMKFWDTPWFSSTPGMQATVREAVMAAAQGESVRQEIALDLPGGRRCFDFSMRPIRDHGGNVVAIVPEAADITDTRQAEEALRQAQKMEAIGQLTGGIAHDFNNMLQGIAGGVELAHRRIKSGSAAEAGHYLDSVRQSTERAAALTHRLLAFSRRQALAPKRVDIDDLITGLSGLIRQTVGPSIRLTMKIEDDCWPVRCDPNQLENAILNLAINARDAMLPHGGELTLRTMHVTLNELDLAGWTGAHPGDFVRISITDTGTGMPSDVLDHVFEPFFTTKPAGHGTGLGLSQVFGFISQSNGVVRIKSQQGVGTSVYLYLPRQPGPAEQDTPSANARPQAGSLVAATVLLVEDEAPIRRFAAEALRDLGCKVIEAEDGPSGLNVLRDLMRHTKRTVDLLVADVGLPGGLNGRQLADAARELSPRLPVLLITGYAGEAFGPGSELANGMELLRKPFALEALTARVGAMLEQ